MKTLKNPKKIYPLRRFPSGRSPETSCSRLRSFAAFSSGRWQHYPLVVRSSLRSRNKLRSFSVSSGNVSICSCSAVSSLRRRCASRRVAIGLPSAGAAQQVPPLSFVRESRHCHSSPGLQAQRTVRY
ncbi:bifunctional ornithine acetyltransferase/N-acetylglutamate synthase [Sesbania bispinosa]|nr:bifunctional ornithine acetyltransferase/N-acetylglutamate synthase [Sesbania bispinosa]